MKGYIVFLNCRKGNIRTKSKEFHLEEGFYAYVGSCGVNCAKRISRHMSKEKRKMHWHIDFASSELCEVIAVLVVPLSEKEIVRSLVDKYEYVIGFGSSDDTEYPSHLFKIDMISFLRSINSLVKD
ncbi:DUF123 domain-containing protein [Stygiolobus azoricus]|uniref:DUF123 domain-containing protein n=1 Tax=Stygiolobus azoricus TaxID=41675 RepID=A0A650CLF0_9CREN|nr:DUF123 domain-containing protein [Stygiolobus azoricus]